MAHSIKSFAKHETLTTTGIVITLAMNDFAPPGGCGYPCTCGECEFDLTPSDQVVGDWIDMSGFKVREISPNTLPHLDELRGAPVNGSSRHATGVLWYMFFHTSHHEERALFARLQRRFGPVSPATVIAP